MPGTVVRTIGDASRLADTVFENVKAEIEEKARAALEAAKQILEKSYQDNLERIENELRRAAREARERLESAQARHEVELRKELARIRAEAVEEILREALSRLRSYVGEEAYVSFLAGLIRDAVEKAGGGGLTIIPVRGDEEYVRRAVEKAGVPGVEVAVSEAAEGMGGFLARTKTGVTLDYRLDVILAQAVEEARARIIETLFR